jgi:hypothetical protein
MSDETFNMSLRKFLKRVGVTSQQHIETAVREAKASGAISGDAVKARMVLTLEGVDGEHVVTGEIELGDDA